MSRGELSAARSPRGTRRGRPSRPTQATRMSSATSTLAVAADLLVEQQRRGADLDEPGIDGQRIVEPRRRAVIGRAGAAP